jgi:hypothetical protein
MSVCFRAYVAVAGKTAATAATAVGASTQVSRALEWLKSRQSRQRSRGAQPHESSRSPHSIYRLQHEAPAKGLFDHLELQRKIAARLAHCRQDTDIVIRR